MIYRKILKPMIDYSVAFSLLILMAPLFALIMSIQLFLNHGKIFFLQPRVGKGERIFTVVKFSSMNNKTDRAGNLLPDSERLTAIGQILRRLSLDELPQLINVLKGEMSLVGPRPLLVEYLPLYNERQRKRHLVKPGITGWAQVNGRNAISWKERFELDLYYVNNLNLFLDIKIFYLTIQKVFKSEGINSENSATMEKFTKEQ